MANQLKTHNNLILWAIISILALILLYQNKMIYINATSHSVTIGYGDNDVYVDYKSVNQSIKNSDKALKEIDELLGE